MPPTPSAQQRFCISSILAQFQAIAPVPQQSVLPMEQHPGLLLGQNFAVTYSPSVFLPVYAPQSPSRRQCLSELIELWWLCHGQNVKYGKLDKAKLEFICNLMDDPCSFQIDSLAITKFKSLRLAKGVKATTVKRGWSVHIVSKPEHLYRVCSCLHRI